MGVRLTKSLFYELVESDKSSVVYTLKEEDHMGFPSLYRLYMESEDPTEYQFAVDHLDGWSHWKILQECTWFKPFLTRWREEKEVRMRSQALAKIIETSKGETRDSFQANKYLVEKGYLPKEDGEKRGRPSKEVLKRRADEILENTARVNADYERLKGYRNKEEIN